MPEKDKAEEENTNGNGAGDRVAIDTNHGSFTIELDAGRAPKSAENFLAYVDAGHYSGTIFHRVISGFMIQGGGYDESFKKKPTRDAVKNEADNGLMNVRGTVAMARTSDPDSATAQFFVNTVDNGFLDHKSKSPSGWGYTVFGKVVDGLDTVDAIRSVTTGSKGPFGKDAPQTDVIITAARRL